MMACLGFFVEELVHLPGPGYDNPDPINAIATVPQAATLQILLGCGIVELATLDKTYGDGEPGDYGFDPLNFFKGKNDAYIADMKLKELTNGRKPLLFLTLFGVSGLAMMAFLGMLVQNLWFHEKLLQF